MEALLVLDLNWCHELFREIAFWGSCDVEKFKLEDGDRVKVAGV